MQNGTLVDGITQDVRQINLFILQLILTATLSQLSLKLFQKPPKFELPVQIIIGITMRLLSTIQPLKEFLFIDESLIVFKLLGDIGMLFLLFMIGLELEPIEIYQKFKQSARISIFSVICPFGSSFIISYLLYPTTTTKLDYYLFALYIAILLSLTALPVLSRLLSELQLPHHVYIN